MIARNMPAGSRRSRFAEMDWHPNYIALFGADGQTLDLPDLDKVIASRAPGLVRHVAASDLIIYAPQATRLRVDRAGGFAVLGAVFDRLGSELSAEEISGELITFSHLLDRYWGHYLAFRRDETRNAWEILRDPSGSLRALLVDGRVGLASDELPFWLLRALGIALHPERSRLANALATPTITAHCSLLSGMEILPAGAAATWDGSWSAPRLVWRAPSSQPISDSDPQAIRNAVECVARAIAGEKRDMVIELSGGLDSAIALGAMKSVAPDCRIVAVNIATPHASGDEREPARDAARLWDIALVEVTPDEGDLDYRLALEGVQPALRNGYGLDNVAERAVSGVCQSFGADRILTGQGGDAVFFQFPSDNVGMDLCRDRGPASLWSRAAMDIARRARCSIWRLQWRMLMRSWRNQAPDRVPPVPIFLTRSAWQDYDAAFGDHTWVTASSALPPAKRFQIFTLANCEWYNGPVARRRHAELVHPLLAQPVVEACLGMPTYRLSHGTQDRALARTLFADLLPPSIARRRLKGETSAYYRRAIVHNLSYLRRHLLEGSLVAAGLLDPDMLAAALDEDALIWRHDARGVVALASLESWARHWGL